MTLKLKPTGPDKHERVELLEKCVDFRSCEVKVSYRLSLAAADGRQEAAKIALNAFKPMLWTQANPLKQAGQNKTNPRQPDVIW